MKHCKSFSFLLAALIGQAASAQTTDPFVALAVPSVPDTVTISTSTNQQTPSTYVGYVVTLTNNHSTTLNVLQFNASTGVSPSTGLTTAVIESAVNQDPTFLANCGISGSTQVACDFSALPPLNPGASLSFPVIVKVPSYTAGVVSSASISFTYNATFKNGNTSSSNTNSFGSISNTTTTPVGALSNVKVRSLVVKNGGSFFTGSNGQASSSDVFTTSVTVPTLTTTLYTTAEINESTFPSCNNFKTCYRSDITIPGTFSPYLTILLREDSSNIKPGTKIESVLIEYFPADGPSVFIGLCANETTPTVGQPCIAKRVYYKNKFVDGWTLDKDGDFEWTIISLTNGGYKIN